MLIYPVERFLSRITAPVPSGYVAVGIHPSSEVDLVDVNGMILGVGAIVPLNKQQAAKVTAVRRAPLQVEADGDHYDVGQRLVLQFYSDCDAQTPPGPRLPVSRAGFISAASLGAVVGAANLVFRLPMHGRRMACIRFLRNTAVADLSLVVVGASYGRRGDALGERGMFVEKTTETWWNGGGVAPQVAVGANLAGQLEVRQVYVGGFGDDAEGFDELLLYVFGAGGGGRAEVDATACGEAL